MDTHTYVHVCTYGGGRQNGCVVRLGRSMETKNETVSERSEPERGGANVAKVQAEMKHGQQQHTGWKGKEDI